MSNLSSLPWETVVDWFARTEGAELPDEVLVALRAMPWHLLVDESGRLHLRLVRRIARTLLVDQAGSSAARIPAGRRT